MKPVGRNDPCPCGSGKKFKSCCLAKMTPETTRSHLGRPLHELDRKLVDMMHRFGVRRFGKSWNPPEAYDWDPQSDRLKEQLIGPLGVYTLRVQDRTINEWFLEEKKDILSDRETSWLEAQRQALLSIWEVEKVDPLIGFSAADLLTGEKRYIHENQGSLTLEPRVGLLARVVDYEGLSVLCGSHPRPLPPRGVAEVVDAVRKLLKAGKKKTIPTARLLDPGVDRILLDAWDDMIEAIEQRPAPILTNTDGDALALVEDHFGIENDQREEVLDCLSRMDGAERDEPAEEGQGFALVFVRKGKPTGVGLEATVIGRAQIEGDELTIETNSLRRAADLRQRVEHACADLIYYQRRNTTTGSALMARMKDAPSPQAVAPPPEAAALIRQVKESHHRNWLDESIPALAGLTPRQAAKDRRWRKELDLLLKEIEHMEAQEPEDTKVEVKWLRRELGLPG